MKKAQKKKRAAALIGACLLCILSALTVFGAVGVSADSDAGHILYLNIPDSPELLQSDSETVLFYGTGCSFHATVGLGLGGNYGPLIPVNTQSKARSGTGITNASQADLFIYGMVTLYVTKDGGIKLKWDRDSEYTVQNSLGLELELGDLTYKDGKWSNTNTGTHFVTFVRNICIEIPTDQTYLANGAGLMSYLGLRIENGYSRGHQAGQTAGYNAGFDDGFNQGVELGQEAGYSQGVTNGMNAGRYEGYQDGHKTGYNEGYDQGFDEGFESGNEIGTETGIELGIDIGEKSAKSDAMDQIEVAKGNASEEDLPIFRDLDKLPAWKEILNDFAGFCYGKGHGDGMADGRTDALNSTNTFKNVVIAIFTAPGHLIDTILDFNLLGINIADLVKTLITVSIVALIAYYVLKAVRG